LTLDADPRLRRYVLKLYVTGTTARSSRAIAMLRRLCGEVLSGRCELKVIDVLEQPQAAEDDRILVTPTLIRELPPPARRVLGDLGDTARVVAELDLDPTPEELAREHAGGVSGAEPAEGEQR